MPLHLEPLDFLADLQNAHAVLIVSCPICPPVSLATADDSAFIDLFEGGFKTPAFEKHIREIRETLGQRGIRSDVFSLRIPCPAMCLWTKGQRRRLRKRARKYDAILVLGCESARLTAEQALENDQRRVVLGMRIAGITNATASLQSPFKIAFKNVARVSGNGIQVLPPARVVLEQFSPAARRLILANFLPPETEPRAGSIVDK